MAVKKITLHPKNSSGELIESTNIYPKTTIDQVYTEDGSTAMGNNYFQRPIIAGNGISITGTTVSVDFGETSFKNMLLDATYPVGAIYISATIPQNNKCPIENTLGGTWERIKDKFLLTAGDTYSAGNTGGDATVTLSESNLPSHYHAFSTTTSTSEYKHSFRGGFGTGNPEPNAYFTSVSVTGPASDVRTQNASNDYVSIALGNSAGQSVGKSGADDEQGFTYFNTVTVTHKSQTLNVSGDTDAVGSGTAFSIIPPYIVVYAWKRTA